MYFRSLLCGVVFALSLATSSFVSAQTNGWFFPTTATYSPTFADNGKILSTDNVPGGSITITLPMPSVVGQGWQMGFNEANGRGIILNAQFGNFILTGQKSMTSVTIPSNTNYEYLVLQSDGTNFHVTYATDTTVKLNGLTGAPGGQVWKQIASTGYASTLADNGTVITSKTANGPVTITLPSTPLLPNGWTIVAYAAGYPITLQLNGVSGGTLAGPTGAQVSTYTISSGASSVSFDGSTFHVMNGVFSGGVNGLNCPSIALYGGVGDNSTDNSAAFVAALAATGTKNMCVSFPPGKFYFAAAQSVNVLSHGSVMIRGSGSEVSLLRFPSGVNGINITLNDRTTTFHIRDVSFLAGGTPQSGASGLAITQAVEEIGSVAMQSDVENVTFRGSDGYAQTDGWTNGVSILDVTNVNFISDAFFGTAAGYVGTETAGVGIFAVGYPGLMTQVAAEFNVISSTFEFLNIGIGYNFNVQGFAVSNSTFVLNNYGLFTDTPALDKAALQFIGNNCNNYVACVSDNTIAGIPFAIYSGNVVFLGTNASGLVFTGNNTVVSDNAIWGSTGANPSSVAINVENASAFGPTIITGNTIGGTPGSSMGTGIMIAAFSQNVRIANNMIDPGTVTIPVVNNSEFGNHNFITGVPANGGAQQISNVTSNLATASESVSAGSPSIVSWVGHGFVPGQSFTFASIGSLTGITAGQTYYISGGATFTPDSFAYAATIGGPNINTGGSTSTLSISTTPVLTRLTVPSTAVFTTGSWVSVNGIVGVPCNLISTVRVVDATHLDMMTCLFGGSYISGGTVSLVP